MSQPSLPVRRGHLLAEGLRVALLVAAAAVITRPFFTGRFVGGTDARWYAYMLQDFLSQVHAGHFPVLVGQGFFAWNGGVHPFRSAPMYLYLAGLWDLVTLHSLGVFALQHVTVITSATAGAVGFYAAAAALLPRRRWEAMLLALLYIGAPAWLAIIYGSEAYMTFMALGALPLALYGNARALLSGGERGYPQLAAGLALVWMCHPPVAVLTTLATLLLQGGMFLFGRPNPARVRAAARGALLFAGFGAFYFVAMSGLPLRPSSPLRDALQFGGLGLALAGLGRGVLGRRGWPWLAVWVPAAGMLWWSCVPWLWWMAATAVLVIVVALAARGLFGFDPARRALEILLPCLLVAAGLAQAWLGPDRPERNLESLAGLRDNAAHATDIFYLVYGPLNQHSYFQPGAGLWILLLLMGMAFFRTRSLPVKLCFVAGLLPVFALVRVPWVSDFLVGYFPDTVAGITNFPLVLRLVPVMAAVIAMGGVVWLAEEGVRSPFGRAGPLLFLLAAVGWCGAEAWPFTERGWRLVATPEASRDILRPENVFLSHFDYDLLPIPEYFWEGVVDPQLEFRLLDAQRHPYTGPDDTARRMEAAGVKTLRLVARSNTGETADWLELEPGLTLAPGEHVLLRFRFDPARNYTGWLIFESEHGYRQYFMPNPGLAEGFGVAPEHSHVISLWNTGSAPEHYRLRMSRAGGNDLGQGQPFATVEVSRYIDALNPVRVVSLDPLRAMVTADKPGWLETIRVFLPGYAATVDGRRVAVVPSPEKLAMVPIPPGRHTVVLRYRGTPGIWLAAVVSALTWAGWLGGLLLRRRRTPAAEPPPEPAAGKDPPDPDEVAVRRLRRWLAGGALVLAIAAVILFYGWTIRTSGASFGAADVRNQYYSQLVAGFRAGHLYMDAPVDPALLALAPDRRPGNTPYLLDASLYHGHYYMYFGVTPAVVLFWPYAVLAGRPLSEAAAALLFAVMGFGWAAAWWLGLRRRCFPGLGGRWAALGVLAIGFGSAAPSALRRPLFYEVAIASGYAFTMLALWAVTEARFRPAHRRKFLALAGVAAGLAVGSRANLAPAELGLLVVGSAAAAWALAAARRRRAFLTGLATAAIGCGGIGAGLAAYNYARFGDPLEFGHRYQLGINPRHMFQLSNLWHNLDIYYLTPPAVNGYFPFVAPALAPPPPADYIGREQVHGEWVWLPLVALAAAAAVLTWRRRRPDWLWLLAPPLVLFAVDFLVTGAAGSRANRYMLDFHPALILATLLVLAPALVGRGAWPTLARFFTAAGIAAVVAFNVLASIQAQGFFALVEPAEFARLADAANRLVWPWMRDEAAAVGDRLVEVRWPKTEAGLGGVWQPILATGTPGFDDVLWIDYDGGTRAQLISEHGEYGSIFGPWFPLPVGGASQLRIGGAFLLPGVGHPWYGDRPADEQAVLKQHLRVTIDGRVRLDRDVPSYDSSPGLQRWGSWRAADTSWVYRFTGELAQPDVEPVDDQWVREALAARGAIRLRLILPEDRFGSTEPLLQSGAPDAFDTLAVQYLDRHSIRLIHDSLGAGADESDPIPADYGRPQSVEIQAPFATDGLRWAESGPVPSRVAPARIRVRWNGRDVFESEILPHPASAASITVGGSLRKSSQARLLYSGLLVESPRQEPLGSVGPGRLECRLPSQDVLADDRGVLIRFARADGESALLVWRHGTAGLQFGWVDADATQWSPSLAPGEAPPDITLTISGPREAAGVAVDAADVVKEEEIEVGDGPASLLDASTDIFSTGPVPAAAILPESWSGSALSASGGGVGAAPAAPELPGRIRIRFRLPPPFQGGEPLLEAGRPVAADSIYLRRLADGRYVLGLDHWLTAATESAPLTLSETESHTLLVEMGSLFTSAAIPRNRLRLILDGRVVLDIRVPLYPVRPGEVYIGRNPLGMSTSDPAFRGEIISVRTRQPPPGPR